MYKNVKLYRGIADALRATVEVGLDEAAQAVGEVLGARFPGFDAELFAARAAAGEAGETKVLAERSGGQVDYAIVALHGDIEQVVAGNPAVVRAVTVMAGETLAAPTAALEQAWARLVDTTTNKEGGDEV